MTFSFQNIGAVEKLNCAYDGSNSVYQPVQSNRTLAPPGIRILELLQISWFFV